MNKKIQALLLSTAMLTTTLNATSTNCDDAGIQLVYLNVNNTNGNYNQTLIGLVDDATEGYDSDYDAEKLFGNAAIGLYTLINGDEDLTPYTIQGIPYVFNESSVPLGVRAGVSGTYTIGLESIENFSEDIAITLEDLQEDITIDLTSETYSFDITVSGDAIDVNQRFVVHFDNPNTVQQITANTGWELISTNLTPTDADIADITASISDDLIVVKDEVGNIYWEEFFINSIGNVETGKAYKIKTSQDVCFLLGGVPLVPEETSLTLTEGWSFMGYIRRDAADVSVLLSDIDDEIQVVKDQAGNIFWPAFGINSIGNMEAGKGYQIKMYSEQSYTYPANSEVIASARRAEPLACEFYDNNKTTHAGMHIMIPTEAWQNSPNYGDEVAVRAADGTIAGTAVFQENNLAISIWENDYTTPEKDGLDSGEAFSIEYYNKVTGQINVFSTVQWEEGNNTYQANKLAVVKRIGVSQFTDNDELKLFGAIPNPTNSNTTITFENATAIDLRFELYNSLGARIMESKSIHYPSGENSYRISCDDLGPGTYYYRMSNDKHSLSGKLSIY